jgi:hypothetical protein
LIATVILSGLVGLVIGLLWCYWKQIRALYDNRDVIQTGGALVGSAQDFAASLKKL